MVDYISLNFYSDFHSLEKKDAILAHLNLLGFHSFFGKKVYNNFQEHFDKKNLLVRDNNKFEAIFETDFPFWKGTKLNFPGINAQRFYFFVKEGYIDWDAFPLLSLSRIDLCFDRISESIDDRSRKDFLLKCQAKINDTNKNSKRTMIFCNLIFKYLDFMIKVHYKIPNEHSITKEKIMFEEVPKNCRYAYARVSSKSQEDNSFLE